MENKIKEIDRNIEYYKGMKKYILEELDQSSSMDYKIYKKYLELGSLTKVNEWLRENNYKYLGEIKFESKYVREIIEKRNPEVPDELNDIVKITYLNEFDWKESTQYKQWWTNWDKLNNGYKKDKVIEELEHMSNLRYKKQIHNQILEYIDNIYRTIETKGKQEGFKYVEIVFNEFLKEQLEG